MAKYGAQYPYAVQIASEPANAAPTYKPDGRTVGKLNKLTLDIQMASGEIYGDDGLAEKVDEFVSASGTLTTTDVTPDNYCYLTGATLSASGEIIDAGADEAPLFGLGYIVVLRRAGKTYYKACFLPKVQASKQGEEANTKSNSLSLSGDEVSLTVYEANDGRWRYSQEFSGTNGLASAQAWILSKAGNGTTHTVEVSKSGDGTVDPLGKVIVKAGEDAEVAVGTPTKLYDNGEDKTAAVADGKYVISAIAADHEVAVVF